MLRSKSSRSAYGDLEDKSHESVLSRTLSASKFCRGDNIGKSVDSKALKAFGRISLDRNPSKTSGRSSLDRNPSKSARFTESQIQRALMVQEHMGQLEQELKWAKDRIFVVEEERKREAKRVVPNMKGNESLLPTKKAGELMTEIKTLKELLSNSKEELKTKDKDIESLRKELEEAKQFEVKLSERDSLLRRMKEDLIKVKESEAFAMNQLLSSKQKITELEDEVQKGKASEAKLLDSLKSQTKQLEQEMVEAEECKLKIASLNQMIVSLKTPIKHEENNNYVPGETKSSGKYEIEFLKKELRSALDAEEKSKKAMDDLALVLTEVAAEANQTKEKLRIVESDLENAKSEAEQLKQMVRNTEEKYKEAENYRNTAERLRVEAEEALSAWNGKEMGFVDCIKRSEEEKNRLNESLKSAEDTTRTVKEESYKLRDILKQAINEANAAKAAATIATDENCQLKDCLSEKDEALHFLTRENERLGLSEAAAYENIKEFKRLLSKTPKKIRNHNDTLKSPSMIVENQDETKKVKKPVNLHYNDLQKDPEKVDQPPKGMIIDNDASPDAHHRRESSVFTDDDETTNSDEFDSDSDKNQNRRKNMFRRVGDLIKRRS